MNKLFIAKAVLVCCVALSGLLFSADEPKQIIIRDFGVPRNDMLSKSDLEQWLPDALLYGRLQGELIERSNFRVLLLPIKDSVTLFIDSMSNTPQYILVLYDDMGTSVLTILKWAGQQYVKHWQSSELVGVGGVKLEDINGDNIPEIIVGLVLSSHGYSNVMIYSWEDGSLESMLPSGEKGISDFKGYVNFIPTDSGTTVESFHPTDGIKREYFLKNMTKKFQSVSEKSMKND